MIAQEGREEKQEREEKEGQRKKEDKEDDADEEKEEEEELERDMDLTLPFAMGSIVGTWLFWVNMTCVNHVYSVLSHPMHLHKTELG